MTFARGQEGERKLLQLTHLIREMEKVANETFPPNIEVKLDLGSDLWTVSGDATQLHQVLLNLFVNARDAMPHGGTIQVVCNNHFMKEPEISRLAGAHEGKYLLLEVSDTGTGIPPEILDKIFEPFFTTKEIGKGTGLGLSTLLSILKNHQAVLDLQSEVGKGTTFSIYLPAASEGIAETEASKANLHKGNGEKILVVDDESAIRDLLESMLQQAGYTPVIAIDGAAAIKIFRNESDQFSLALVDLLMPGLSGAATVAGLKEISPDLPFIAMTGIGQNDSIREQFGAEPAAFIMKPFSSEKLLDAIHDILQKDQVSIPLIVPEISKTEDLQPVA